MLAVIMTSVVTARVFAALVTVLSAAAGRGTVGEVVPAGGCGGHDVEVLATGIRVLFSDSPLARSTTEPLRT
eukprot:8249530-Pyramimonas_sp.AAC.1